MGFREGGRNPELAVSTDVCFFPKIRAPLSLSLYVYIHIHTDLYAYILNRTSLIISSITDVLEWLATGHSIPIFGQCLLLEMHTLNPYRV